MNFKGHLLKAINKIEEKNAIPIDKFVIDEQKKLILPNGEYLIQIISCEGALVKEFELKVGE